MYITSTCILGGNVVLKDEQRLFEQKEAADLPAFLLSVYQYFGFNYPKFYKMDNQSKLGWLAAELLLTDGFDKTLYRPDEVAVILSNTNASLDADLRYYDSVADIPSPALFVYTLPNIVIGEICIRHGFKGENIFFVQEQFDAGFLLRQVTYLLEQDLAKACICGWVDVLGMDYKATLFLIERNAPDNALPFTVDNINRIFEQR